jgi:hypothetical protein
VRNAYPVFVGKPEGKGPHGRLMHRWEDNIRKDLTGIGWEAAVRVKVKLSLCLSLFN